ncbi:MAG: hypothetical protein HC850_07635 [Rhodomicrobium sp.]|nr:hypothetical protein [Rhodomicrobium sp.]
MGAELGSSLAEFGRRWLGSDPETGEPWGERSSYGLDADLAERAAASPRRYGLHATIKAPFRLAEGTREDELADALDAFGACRRRIRSAPCASTASRAISRWCRMVDAPG